MCIARGLNTKDGQPLFDAWQQENLGQFGLNLVNNGFGRGWWRKQANPGCKHKTRDPSFNL